MIWHIFKKDWKLTWPVAVAAALLNAIPRVILAIIGISGSVRLSPMAAFMNLLSVMAPMVAAVLIVLAIQQDALAGLRQDWLVRPIRRRDLLLSKLLFVVLVVQTPVFVLEVGQGLAGGFSLRESVAASLSRALLILLAFDLPFVAFASLTRNFAEAIGAGVIVMVGAVLFTSTAVSVYPFMAFRSGITWVTDSVQLTLVLIGAAVVLTLQYFRRKTNRARWVFGCGALLCLFAELMPWQPAFAVQERFSSQPAAANPVEVSFNPGSGRYKHRPGQPAPRWYGVSADDVPVWIPVTLTGAGDDRKVVVDRTAVRLTAPDGKAVKLASEPPTQSLAFLGTHQPVWVPGDVYNRIKDQPSRLEIDYSLTLMQQNAAQTIPALGGDRRIPDVGSCVTKTNGGNTAIVLNCIASGNPPCTTWFLEDPRAGKRANANGDGCSLNYSPYFERVMGDSMSRFGTTFQFRDPTGLVHYPVDESELKDSRVVFQTYHPLAHFTRQVVIPDIRLSDWTPQ